MMLEKILQSYQILRDLPWRFNLIWLIWKEIDLYTMGSTSSGWRNIKETLKKKSIILLQTFKKS